MSQQSPRVLLCRCAQAELVPAPVRITVLDALRSAGTDVLEVDDLCGLAGRRDDRLANLAGAGRPVVVLACFPRAVRWLFAFAGAPLPEHATILNLRTSTAAEVLEGFRIADCGLRIEADDQPEAQSQIRNPKSEMDAWVPWFPVIDYDRCRHCRQCANFCLFGVYAVDDGDKVRVVQPDKCKTNCPACARLCPQAAIMFPKCAAAPINGDEVTPENVGREHVGEELLPQAGGDAEGSLLATLRKRAMQMGNSEFAIRSSTPTAPGARTSGSPESPVANSESDLPASVQRVLDSARQRAAQHDTPSESDPK